MKEKAINRRQFLETSGLAAAGAATVAAAGVGLDANAVWALTVDGLGEHTAGTLLRMARLLYPHDALGDDFYAEIIENLGRRAGDDSSLAELLTAGVSTLDEAGKSPWLDLGEAEQLEILTDIEGSAFFVTVQNTVLNDVYSDPRLWEAVGYQGSSLEFGGYINRGFDDIDWLPED